jgi:hypothetical protein
MMDKMSFSPAQANATKGFIEQGYYEFDAYSYSALKNIVPPSTPFHYLLYRKLKPKPTPDMQEGTDTHTAILEPERFKQDFVTFKSSYDSMRTNAAKKELADFEKANKGKRVVTDEYYKNLWQRAENAWSRPLISSLLRDEITIIEKGMYWMDEITGVTMKAKVDAFNPISGVVADVKTFRDIRDNYLAREIAERLYFMQAAIYSDGITELYGIEVNRYYIFAVEKPTNMIRVVALSDYDIEVGRDLYRKAIIKAEDCRLTNNWHGYIDNDMPFELSPYLMNRFEEVEL